jgi:predicted ATPase
LNRLIVTGAPGTGKTAVLEHVTGVRTIAEPARQVLAEHRAANDAALPPHEVFVAMLLARAIEDFEAAGEAAGPVLFDRGVPDCIAYAEWLDTDTGAAEAAARRYRYHPEVLLFAPWEEIYTTDAERSMTFAMVEGFHGVQVGVYERLGYGIVEVPRVDIPARARFVEAWVARSIRRSGVDDA